VLLANGTRDPYVPEELSDRLAELLRECGAEVTYLKAERGHELAPDELGGVRDWLGGLTRPA
jgi:predicted esterase